MGKTEPKKKWTGKALATVQHDEYLSEAFLIDIKEGEVLKVELISQAPDLMSRTVGQAMRYLWSTAKDNKQ